MKTTTLLCFRSPFLLLTMILTLGNTVQAQDTLVPLHTLIYEVKLKLLNGQKMEGYLKTVTDSTIVYTTEKTPVGAPAQASDQTVGYARLARVSLRKKGAVGKGAAIGAAVGIGIGAGIGFAIGDDPPDQLFSTTAGEKAAAFSILGALTGTLVGALIGHSSQKFQIDGTREGMMELRRVVYEKIYGKASPAQYP